MNHPTADKADVLRRELSAATRRADRRNAECEQWVKDYMALERDLTRLRTACLAIADEMERTGRQGDAKRLREIAKS